jgi:hypothetical protein
MYFSCTVQRALELAIYQSTKGLDPEFKKIVTDLTEFNNSHPDDDPSEKLIKPCLRLAQVCPNTIKFWSGNTKVGEKDYQLSYTALIGNDWISVQDILPPKYSGAWMHRFPLLNIASPPTTPDEYLNTPLAPLAEYAYKIKHGSGASFHGFMQFPVIVQGSSTGLFEAAAAPLDLWDILAMACTKEFWTIGEAFIKNRARWDFYELCDMDTFDFDASARVLQHDPFIHIVLRNYHLHTAIEIMNIVDQVRSEMPGDLRLRDVCFRNETFAENPETEHLANLPRISQFAFADVALLAVLAIQMRRTMMT